MLPNLISKLILIGEICVTCEKHYLRETLNLFIEINCTSKFFLKIYFVEYSNFLFYLLQSRIFIFP